MKRITQFILCIVLAVSAYGQGVGGNSVPRTVSGISAALDLISSTQGTVFYRGASGWEALPPGTSGQLFSTQGAAANPIWVTATGGAGDVNGPTLGTATDNAIVRFDGTGGKTVQNSAVTIADTTGAMTWATGQAATLTGGDNGASLALGSGASGTGTLSINTRAVRMASASGYTGASDIVTGGAAWLFSHPTSGNYLNGLYSYTGTGSINNLFIGARDDLVFGSGGGSTADAIPDRMRLKATGNLLIGTTTDMASTAGGLTVAATGSGATATAVNTGGLRSANFGLSTVSGGASYFGGLVSSDSRFYASGGGGGFWAGASDLTLGFYDAAGAMVFRTSGINQLTLAATTGAATFAGTVTMNSAYVDDTLSSFLTGNTSSYSTILGNYVKTAETRSGTVLKSNGSIHNNFAAGSFGWYVGQGVGDTAYDTYTPLLGITSSGATFANAVVTSSATLSGAGAIPITTSLVKFTSTGGAQALTLANGVDGQRLTIVHDVDGGSGILTPTTKTGFSAVTFTNVGDTVDLVYVTTRGWMVTGSYGSTIAP